jgi:hypothetical protein
VAEPPLPFARPPQESLSLELKTWLDPASPQHKAVAVRGLMALRNRNGGQLLIGFKDDGEPRSDAPNFDLKKAYHADLMQDLIAAHASQRFEVEVEVFNYAGAERVRITAPAGVIVPVAVRSAIKHPETGKPDLLAFGEVPFRTLAANGRPSTAACQPGDWPDLMAICFDNREADIGRFLRRHLASPTLPEALRTLLGAPPDPSLADQAWTFLQSCETRFAEALERRASPDAAVMRPWGGRSAALVFTPRLSGWGATRDFKQKIQASVPRFTTYPPWVDYGLPGDDAPVVRQGAWEQLVVARGMVDALEFSVLDPRGQFFQWRLVLPDVIAAQRPEEPKTYFDPQGAIVDVAETILTGLALAASFGVATADQVLTFAFRWEGLQGRQLVALRSVGFVRHLRVAREEAAQPTVIIVPADTALSAVAPFVEEILRPIFEIFDGEGMDRTEVEHLVRELVERRSTF